MKCNYKDVKISNEEELASSEVFFAGNARKNKFIVDSEAASNMWLNKKYSLFLVSFSGTIKRESENKKKIEIKGVGNIIGKFSNGMEITLNIVLYSPHLNG